MTIDLTGLPIGTECRQRNGVISTLIWKYFPDQYIIANKTGYSVFDKHGASSSPTEYDIIEILTEEKDMPYDIDKKVAEYQKTKTVIDLRTAKSGDKFLCRNGETFVFVGKAVNKYLAHLINDDQFIIWLRVNGTTGVMDDKFDIIAPAPHKLSGWVNVYDKGSMGAILETKMIADGNLDFNRKRIACIDLSQFTEGHGL